MYNEETNESAGTIILNALATMLGVLVVYAILWNLWSNDHQMHFTKNMVVTKTTMYESSIRYELDNLYEYDSDRDILTIGTPVRVRLCRYYKNRDWKFSKIEGLQFNGTKVLALCAPNDDTVFYWGR